MASDPPTDAPGEDCPDHGPHADEQCPKCELASLDLPLETADKR